MISGVTPGDKSGRDEVGGNTPGRHDTAVTEAGASAALPAPGHGCLGLVATPIGNLGDISARALDWLRAADFVACEDSRVSGRLLQHFGIDKKLIIYHDHNAEEVRPVLLRHLADGQRIALVSDAGTPLISDPGYKLVREAIAAGANIVAVPGPSAVLAGLTLSGLPSDRFLFAGFLPPRAGERKSALEELKGVRATLVFFESAQRLGESLEAMADVLGDRPAAMTRELTKLHEEARRGSLRELAAHYATAGAPKGEVTLLVGPPLEASTDDAKVDAALKAALAFMPVKAAAEMIAGLTGGSRKTLYARALELKDDAKN